MSGRGGGGGGRERGEGEGRKESYKFLHRLILHSKSYVDLMPTAIVFGGAIGGRIP